MAVFAGGLLAVAVLAGGAAGSPPGAAALRKQEAQTEARHRAAVLSLFSLETQLTRARDQLASVRSRSSTVRREGASVRLELEDRGTGVRGLRAPALRAAPRPVHGRRQRCRPDRGDPRLELPGRDDDRPRRPRQGGRAEPQRDRADPLGPGQARAHAARTGRRAGRAHPARGDRVANRRLARAGERRRPPTSARSRHSRA